MTRISIERLVTEYDLEPHEVLASLDLAAGTTEVYEPYAREVLDILTVHAADNDNH